MSEQINFSQLNGPFEDHSLHLLLSSVAWKYPRSDGEWALINYMMRVAPLVQSQWWTLISVIETCNITEGGRAQVSFLPCISASPKFLDFKEGNLRLLNQVCMQDFYKIFYDYFLSGMSLCNISSLQVKKDIYLATLPTQPGLDSQLV